MEFFEWMGIAQGIASFIIGMAVKEESLGIAKRDARIGIIVGLSAGAALFALCLILGGFGLYKMAKNKGKKYRFLAFIPFANTFYAGYVAGETRVFGQKMKRMGLYAMLAEIVYVALNVLILVADILMINYYQEIEVTSSYDPDYHYMTYGPTFTSVPSSLRWLYTATYANSGFGWAYILNYVFFIVYVLFLGITLNALFRQYAPRGYIGYVLLCILFPVRGFVFFALRNRAPVDYDEYMRRRMEEYARRQQQYGPYGPYGQGPYGPYGQGPYNQPPYNNGQPPYSSGQPTYGPQQGEPFSDFGGAANGQNGQGGQSNGQGNGPTPPPDDDPFSDF